MATERTYGDVLHAAGIRLTEKLLTFPGLVITFFTISLGLGLFTQLVEVEKFKSLCGVYQVIFLGWAAGGLVKKKLDNGKPPA